MRAETATLTGYWVNLEIFDGIEAAKLLAQATLGTCIFVYVGNLPAPELVILPDGRAE
jgi:hypothetical protein